MRGLTTPLVIFNPSKSFNDRTADDMKCGDMSESILKHNFGLTNVSERVDPYTFKQIRVPGFGNLPDLNREQTAAILFDRLRFEATTFAFWGKYTHIVTRLFTHMQYKQGQDFNDACLNQAYKQMIEEDNTPGNAKAAIREVLNRFTDWQYGLTAKDFQSDLSDAHLPKFDRMIDRINGLGISVHDVNSTQITLESITFRENSYTAVLQYKGQDHFGLDVADIQKFKFKYWQIFRMWFVLQRYQKLAYAPFFVNMNARITIQGISDA